MTLREQDGPPRQPIYILGCACREGRLVQLDDDECKVLRRALSVLVASAKYIGEKILIDHEKTMAKLRGDTTVTPRR